MMDHARSKEAKTISVPSEDGTDADGDNEEGWYEKNGKFTILVILVTGRTQTGQGPGIYTYMLHYMYICSSPPPPTLAHPPSED